MARFTKPPLAQSPVYHTGAWNKNTQTPAKNLVPSLQSPVDPNSDQSFN
uniref:Uncharacterized protein n=1 Tax=Anguilla anguilla TaxID=7936 RepID=A0A0E9RXN2_ANGAN